MANSPPPGHATDARGVFAVELRRGPECVKHSKPLTAHLVLAERAAMKATRTCIVDDCDRDATAREWCNMHYRRLLKRGILPPIITPTRCSVEGCTNGGGFTHGMCGMHNKRMTRHGTTDLRPPSRPSLADRFTSKLVRMSTDCLEWTGLTNTKGYGSIKANGRTIATHRVAWELANGPIPDGLWVLHHCDHPPCCQTEPTEGYPEGHLFLGTHDDNMADMVAKGRSVSAGAAKTHCDNGHPFSETNTHVSLNGYRRCLICHRAANARYYAKKKAG